MIKFTLSNGLEMPAIGIGTFMLQPPQAEEAVCTALQLGYRLVDTANGYMNERAVGRGIRKSGVAREEVFISTKLWPSEYEKDTAVDKCLELLGVDYIDLLYIHQPSGNYIAGYQKLEKAYKEGKVKSIGISNFEGERLANLLANAEIMPHVIQLEAHPYYIDSATMDTLAPHGTKLMAWYPLGHGAKDMLEEPLFVELGAKYGKTTAQIILRWHIQMGICPIPGSKSPEHIRENGEVFDFELTDTEMAEIAKLNKGVRYYNPDPERIDGFAKMAIPLDMQP